MGRSWMTSLPASKEWWLTNRLSARDRDMLNDDLNRVRDYRAHHEAWH